MTTQRLGAALRRAPSDAVGYCHGSNYQVSADRRWPVLMGETVLAIEANTADELWRGAWNEVTEHGTRRQHSRGDSHELLHVVMELSDPRQRWITGRRPAINPAFAIAEVVWMMRGRNDAEFLKAWNRSLPNYAGEGTTFHGAYGERLRIRFGFDQLGRAASILRASPEQRQVVLQIWDPGSDMPLDSGVPQSRDVPCNVVSVLKVVDEKLEWLQIMRSNDLVRGLPYNFVQWTMLHEILAGWAGLDLGAYVHVSDSLHIYAADRESFNATSPVGVKSSSDLRLAFEESELVFANLEQAMAKMAESTSPDQVRHLAETPDTSVYADWLCVMAAERLRRLGRPAEGRDALKSVRDPLLQTASDLWFARYWKASS